MDTKTAAQLILKHVHQGANPGTVAMLARLAQASQVLRSAGINPLDKAKVVAAAKR